MAARTRPEPAGVPQARVVEVVEAARELVALVRAAEAARGLAVQAPAAAVAAPVAWRVAAQVVPAPVVPVEPEVQAATMSRA